MCSKLSFQYYIIYVICCKTQQNIYISNYIYKEIIYKIIYKEIIILFSIGKGTCFELDKEFEN